MILRGARIFDGNRLHSGMALVAEGETITALRPDDGQGNDLGGGILAPAFLDLQVNGGGGMMLDSRADPASIAHICAAHARLGATGILPTLITDRPAATQAAIAAGIAAAKANTPGFIGLHLEGPHLDPMRCGAHDPELIRPMDDEDLALLIYAAEHLPTLIVTLAPVSARPDQIKALSRAGAIVSLGHAECRFEDAKLAMEAGASMATHLFNAMSPLGSREPGLVGAGLSLDLDCGIIADGVHVHPATLALALRAKSRGRMFLVSDAMAVAGTEEGGFMLGDRRILRRDGRLTLEDGTLAGADLSLPQAVGNMVRMVGLDVETALVMASRIPAQILGLTDRGVIAPGMRTDLVHLSDDFALRQVWQDGVLVQGEAG